MGGGNGFGQVVFFDVVQVGKFEQFIGYCFGYGCFVIVDVFQVGQVEVFYVWIGEQIDGYGDDVGLVGDFVVFDQFGCCVVILVGYQYNVGVDEDWVVYGVLYVGYVEIWQC